MANFSSLIGFLILVADIYAIVMVVQSSVPNVNKLIWAVVIILLPVVGLVVWFLVGPGQKPF